MLKILGGIIGLMLLIPIALTLVAIVVCTLVGGYIGVILHFAWKIVLTVVLVIILCKIIKHLFNR